MASSATARAVAPAHGPVQDHFKGEDFTSLLDETLGRDSGFDGSVVTGRVIRIDDDHAVVDVGLKSEGRIALKEFGPPGSRPDVKPGDLIELYVERYEDRDGSIVLSREKARREEAWTNLEKAFEAQKRVDGIYCQPDFYYEPRFWVFCDGSPHDEEATQQRDAEQRQLIIARGDEVWAWHYREDLATRIAQRPDVFRKVR